jgi:hypothetical protein
MVIRDKQVAVFRDVQQARAEDELAAHCREFAPRVCQVAGDTGVREVVRIGITRARQYGFEDSVRTRFYIEVMLTLGSDFDTDPQFPWAAEILKDDFSRPHVRAMVLHRDIAEYMERVMGNDREHVKAALDRFLQLPPEAPPPEQRNRTDMRTFVRGFFPQKSESLDDPQLAQIVEAADRQTGEFNLPAGRVVIAGVMLVFGHGAARDPLYPWISGVLRDPLIEVPEGRVQRLYARLRTYANSARGNMS